jgi:tetratricopeptide (TPR) repeat protein
MFAAFCSEADSVGALPGPTTRSLPSPRQRRKRLGRSAVYFFGGLLLVAGTTLRAQEGNPPATRSPIPQEGTGGSSLTSQHLAKAEKALAAKNYALARQLLELALRADSNSAEAHFMMADLDMRCGRTHAAIGHFQRALELQPQSFAGHYNLALAFLRERRPEDGLRELRRAVEINSRHADAIYNLGLILLETGKLEEALDRFRQARELGPDRPDLAYNLTRAELKANRPHAAIEEAERSATAFGKDPGWRLAMGALFLENEQSEEAIHQFLEASRLQPRDPKIRYQLAAAYLQSNRPEDVLALFKDPSGPEEYYLRASAAYLLGRYAEADEDSIRSLQNGQADPRYLLLRARIDQHSSRQKAALQTLQRAATLAPHWSEVFYSQAVSHYFLGEYEDVRRSLDQALELSPNSARYLFLYAISYGNEGRSDEVEYLRRAVALDPSNARFRCHLGAALLRQNRTNEALQAFELAVQLKPDYALPHYELGKILARQKKFDAAAEELETSIHYQPDLVPALYQLSRVYAALGQKERAASALAQFLTIKGQQTAESRELADDVTQQLQLP